MASQPNWQKLARYEKCEELSMGFSAHLVMVKAKKVELYEFPSVGRIDSSKPLLLAPISRDREQKPIRSPFQLGDRRPEPKSLMQPTI